MSIWNYILRIIDLKVIPHSMCWKFIIFVMNSAFILFSGKFFLANYLLSLVQFIFLEKFPLQTMNWFVWSCLSLPPAVLGTICLNWLIDLLGYIKRIIAQRALLSIRGVSWYAKRLLDGVVNVLLMLICILSPCTSLILHVILIVIEWLICCYI